MAIVCPPGLPFPHCSASPMSMRPAPGQDPAIPPLGITETLVVLLAAVIPMGLLAFGATPWLIPRLDIQPGLVVWMMIVVGMIWQFPLALWLLRRERRHSVLDLGAGPGRDGEAFLRAGHAFVGLDLAHENAVLARSRGVTVVHGSIAAPPFRPAAFDAGWSMSTLMHVPEARMPAVLAAITMPLRPGAPLAVGLWGGDRGDEIDDTRIKGHRRLFSHRAVDRNRELLERCGAIERSEVWDIGRPGEEYQVFVIRTPSA